ncbi:MAG: PepSY-like domain-containing protein [Bacteroidota bacterium]
MKRLSIFLFALIVLDTAAFALTPKKHDAPKAVIEAFAQKFPLAQKVKWEKEKSDYETNFIVNGVPASANFAPDGKWMETEADINVSNVPKIVVEGIHAAYPGSTIVAASQIETPDAGLHYEADIMNGRKKSEVLFDALGKEIKQQ